MTKKNDPKSPEGRIFEPAVRAPLFAVRETCSAIAVRARVIGANGPFVPAMTATKSYYNSVLKILALRVLVFNSELNTNTEKW